MRTIVFYRNKAGTSPVEEFLDSLSGKQAQKVLWVLKLVEELETVPRKFLKKLVNTDDIWEVRVQRRKRQRMRFGLPKSANRTIWSRKNIMSDLQKYINKRMKSDEDFADNFYEGYESFKVGVLLRKAREAAGKTQTEMALQLSLQRAMISKVENRPDEVRFSIIQQYAEALGKNVYIGISG